MANKGTGRRHSQRFSDTTSIRQSPSEITEAAIKSHDVIGQRDQAEPLRVNKGRQIPVVSAQLDAECRVETIESPTDHTKTLLAIYQNGKIRVDERFKWKGDVLVPKERGHGVFKLVRLPKGVAPYKSVQSLLEDTGALLCACVDIPPKMAVLASAYVLSSIFPEKVPVAPYL